LYAEVPDGWHIPNEASADFEVGVTKGTNDSSVGYVRSVVDEPSGHGGFMQKVSAADYRGVRLDNLRFDGVGEGTADSAGEESEIPSKPSNLSFEE